ncbi:MAG: type II toxin-antitoxin system PemK/MazF family toxin [Legionellaceae bacterium]|nr:type II toxin-antitoxin system PemK/MazF family toxin [Legionellaceae bacterium]
MAISYRPKVGEILECNFGQFRTLHTGDFDLRHFDGRIPPEMVKRRPVVVLNGKLGGGCLVVPISSSQDLGGINQRIHVHIEPELFPATDFYDVRDRWVKAELIQAVSVQRLFKLIDNGVRFDHYFPREKVEQIQRAVVRSVSASTLLK